MITQNTLDFLKELKKNNNKEWFEDHKLEYRDARWEFMSFVQDIAHEIAKFDKRVKDSLDDKKTIKFFRQYRDIRFSKNKDPYKVNFGGVVNPYGMESGHAGYYIHIEPTGKSFIAGGMYMPESKQLDRIRRAIIKDSKPIRKILANKDFIKYYKALVTYDDLKVAPKGYDKAHPDIDVLRHKHFNGFKYLTDKEVMSKNFGSQTIKALEVLEPLNEYLDKVSLKYKYT